VQGEQTEEGGNDTYVSGTAASNASEHGAAAQCTSRQLIHATASFSQQADCLEIRPIEQREQQVQTIWPRLALTYITNIGLTTKVRGGGSTVGSIQEAYP